jgi:hypothetical protein
MATGQSFPISRILDGVSVFHCLSPQAASLRTRRVWISEADRVAFVLRLVELHYALARLYASIGKCEMCESNRSALRSSARGVEAAKCIWFDRLSFESMNNSVAGDVNQLHYMTADRQE